jgi:alpha-beta hydrolase superfamily lysophospholipase
MTYVLVPGAGGEAWYWHLVTERLRAAGHEVIAPDLPAADPDAGLQAYADTITDAAGDRERVTLVAQSMAAFSAPMARLDVAEFILVAPMIPAPGEKPGEWWRTSGHAESGMPPFDPIETFFHDVPQHLREEAFARGEPRQADAPMADPWPLDGWPDTPTRVVACRDDRLIPFAFMRQLAHDRLGGLEVEPIDAGHLPALSRPDELTALLMR